MWSFSSALAILGHKLVEYRASPISDVLHEAAFYYG